MLVLFALGGLQGFVGWWMVTSGLETRVSVSQYRLAIHLGVAIILLGAILWTALEYLRSPLPPPRGEVEAPKALRVGGMALVVLIYLQMLLGALVAGLHGGLVYNTWPSMDGRVLPELNFTWVSFFEDAGLAQFDHRIGAYVVFVTALALAFRIRSVKLKPDGGGTPPGLVAALALFQVVLGIVALVTAGADRARGSAPAHRGAAVLRERVAGVRAAARKSPTVIPGEQRSVGAARYRLRRSGNPWRSDRSPLFPPGSRTFAPHCGAQPGMTDELRSAPDPDRR